MWWCSLDVILSLSIGIFIHVVLLQRVSVLVRQNEFGKALQLALSFYDGSAKAVVG